MFFADSMTQYSSN